jgi:putative membrane protein
VKDLGEEDGDDKSRRTRRGTDRSTEESIEESIEESTEESIEESIEESTDRSIEKYIDKPINRSIDEPIDKAIVLASGNLGLIYFTASKERLSLEEINRRYPHLISGLLRYPEIGFLMVRSAAQGPLVIGAKGIYHLWEGWAQGEDPLESYGRLAPRQLIYEDSFDNCPDILVNSFYSQETDEVAAFEELVGSHGGLGGSQTKGILIYPADLPLSLEPIVGASSLHRAIKQWVPAE